MQDRYVGDVGDFGKYGLLRKLCAQDEHGAEFRLGVLWYRFTGQDPTKANDGKHTQYLDLNPPSRERNLRDCDQDLFKKVRRIVASNDRNIEAIERDDILPPKTLYFSEGLSFEGISSSEVRSTKRRSWLDAGMATMAKAEVVFFDPDNGLQIPSRKRTDLQGPKHVYYDDLLEYWGRGKSLVIYHHLSRNGKSGDQISRRCQNLRDQLKGVKPLPLRFKRRSPRVFFVLPAKAHRVRLRPESNHSLNLFGARGNRHTLN